MFDHISGYHGPSKLIRKMNAHNVYLENGVPRRQQSGHETIQLWDRGWVYRASFALFTPICASPLCCFYTWTGGALCSSEQMTTRSPVRHRPSHCPSFPLGRFLERIISTPCFHFFICYALTVFVWLLSPLTIALVPKFRGRPWTSAALDTVSTPNGNPSLL